jgi:hypothetical protein
MAATVQIHRKTGVAPGSGADITSINTRAATIDAHSADNTAQPIQIPTVGSNYSYWVTTRLNVVVGPAGTINNLRWFADGANNFGTGVTVIGAKASTGANAGYRQATGTPGTTGVELNQTNHTGLDAAAANVFTHTSGSPLSLAGSTSGTGEFGDHFVYQIVVGSTAAPGELPVDETLTWRYDET